MRFNVLSVLGLAAAANAVMDASQVTANIDAVTQQSSEANEVAEDIGPLNIFSKGPMLVNDFKQIVTTVQNDITAMNNKRSLQARQECLDITNLDECEKYMGVPDAAPVDILGRKTRRQNQEPYSEAEQFAVCNSFGTFVRVHQQLLNTVIGKHGLLALTPFTQPIAAVLRAVESVVDQLAFGLIDLVPTCSQGAMQDKNNLDDTLGEAINTYQPQNQGIF